jgi:rhomboid family protein
VIPLGESVSTRSRPIVTTGLIIANALVFLYELTLRPSALDAFIARWGAVPRIVVSAALGGDPRVPRTELVTLFSSQFIHAGFLHIGGNMLFLWVFGRAVEDRLRSPVYLVFYLLAGAFAGLVQSFISSNDSTPLVGASGAIAGVLGMYFVAYPTAWVRVLVPVLFFFWTFDLPAVLVLAFWFVSQFFNGLTAITHVSRATGDVAVWAHVAGFGLGAVSAFVLPTASAALPRGYGAPAMRRSDAPGPARLVSSLADLAALLLVVRVVLKFFGVVGALGALATPILAVTQPVVGPFDEFIPPVRILGGMLETGALVAVLAVYVLAGLIGQLLVKK